MPRSSRGLGRRPFTAVARVRIPYAVPFMEPVAQSVRAPGCGPGGRGFNSHRAPKMKTMPRSSRGLGRRPFTAVARVRIPYAVLFTPIVIRVISYLLTSLLFIAYRWCYLAIKSNQCILPSILPLVSGK